MLGVFGSFRVMTMVSWGVFKLGGEVGRGGYCVFCGGNGGGGSVVVEGVSNDEKEIDCPGADDVEHLLGDTT